MLHIMIKKSFAREINKAMGKDNLEALKKEIISILEKADSKEYKKAIEFFEKTEKHYTHLEKSISGEWIEKAGYGVGTVRIWRGKKYKKVAPKKWVRVFDKMDRGAKGSMTRLINKVKACNSEEELYQFCMSNHSIFQDENGNDLPIMDKLRAAIDDKKETITGESKKYTYGLGEEQNRAKQQYNEEVYGDKKVKKEEADLHNISRKLSQIPTTELRKEQDKLQRAVENKTRSKRDSLNNVIFSESNKKQLDNINKELDKRNEKKNKESESEKHQNRSDAMKGNKNAYKGGSDEELPTKGNKVSDETLDNIKKKSYQEYIESSKNATLENLKKKLDFWKDSVEDIKHKRPVDYTGDDGKPSDALLKMDKARIEGIYQAIQDMIAEKEYFEQEYEYYKNNLSKDSDLKTIKEDLVKEKRNAEKKNDTKRLLWIKAKEKVIEELESEKHQNRSDAMKGNDNAKPTITFDRNGRLGEKAVNTKLGTDNIKALDALPEKFDDDKRIVLKYPSEVEIDGEKKLAYTNGQFLVVTHDIPANGVKTKQSEKIEGNYPNVEKVIPKEFKDNSAPKVDINIDQVMKDLPKVDFSKKAFNDDSHKQFMKIGNFWYDAKMVKATYDMLKGDNAEVLESKDTYSNGRFGRLCIKTDKGYSVILSLSNDYAENYSKQAIYDSDKGSMSANDKAAYENKKKTGLTDDQFNNAVSFGYTPDNKGFMHGSDKDISFKASGRVTEFYYKGVPTGYKNRSSLLFDKKDYIDEAVDNCKSMVEHRIDEYKEGQKEPANMPANYDKTFPKMTNENLTDIYKWWSDPKNTEKLIYQGQSGRKGVPGVGGNVTSRMLGKVESAVMKMLPDIKDEIQRRGITIKKSVDGELYFETSLESYVKKSISVLKKSLLA